MERNVSKSIVSANILDVDVTHNGYQGGDAGHGGFVKIKLSNGDSTAYGVEVRFGGSTEVQHIHHADPKGEGFIIEQPRSITLNFQGDTERRTLIEALEFVLDELKKEY
jgi:hypothetical protein